ncbi:MAG: hypothetical protein HYX76_10460 [Acidobacteria bacterium]|nr:hypothetical protein [Acidobacteriota bacterium]
MRAAQWLAIGIVLVLSDCSDLQAINLALSRSDLERAVALARWPHSDSDRARFHAPYIVAVKGLLVDYVIVDRIEVITGFRRLELLAEEHARLNDLWGRPGVRDAEEALRPWRDRVSIVAHLRFQVANQYITGVPPVAVALGEPEPVAPIDVRRLGMYRSDDHGSVLIGATVETTFDARSVGQTVRQVLVRWDGRELARATMDFARLE